LWQVFTIRQALSFQTPGTGKKLTTLFGRVRRLVRPALSAYPTSEDRDQEEIVPSIHDTAYPRLKASVTARDLAEIYTPTCQEQALAATLTPSSTGQTGFLILLKTFRRLGYFVPVQAVPQAIVEHIAAQLGTTVEPQEWRAYDASGTRRRHMAAIRAHLHVRLYDREAQHLLDTTIRTAAATKEDLADLVNVGIEELIRQHWELPGFTTLRRTAQRERAAVNRALFQQVAEVIGAEGHQILDQLFAIDETTRQAPGNRIKADPGRPTLTQLRELVARLQWLTPLNVGADALAALPAVKVQQFATEALSLDVARMQRLTPAKQHAWRGNYGLYRTNPLPGVTLQDGWTKATAPIRPLLAAVVPHAQESLRIGAAAARSADRLPL
jgi:Domain of unknown function (DUF4158)